jgi:hypothetical protein
VGIKENQSLWPGLKIQTQQSFFIQIGYTHPKTQSGCLNLGYYWTGYILCVFLYIHTHNKV